MQVVHYEPHLRALMGNRNWSIATVISVSILVSILNQEVLGLASLFSDNTEAAKLL